MPEAQAAALGVLMSHAVVEKMKAAGARLITPSGGTSPFRIALDDFLDALARHNLWRTLGVLDVRRRYRRTVIGPFWASGHILLYILCVGFVFATLLEAERAKYIPYLTTGYIAWVFVYNVLNESPGCFSSATSLRQQVAFPYFMFVFQMLLRNLFVHMHNYILFALMMIFYPVEINVNFLLLIPGYVLVLVNLFWLSALLATLAARYRDVQQLISSVIQVLVFLTPIFYSADRLTQFQRDYLVGPNLLYHLVLVLRSPLMGEVPPLSSYLILIFTAIVGSLFTAWFFGKRKSQIIYWIM